MGWRSERAAAPAATSAPAPSANVPQAEPVGWASARPSFFRPRNKYKQRRKQDARSALQHQEAVGRRARHSVRHRQKQPVFAQAGSPCASAAADAPEAPVGHQRSHPTRLGCCPGDVDGVRARRGGSGTISVIVASVATSPSIRVRVAVRPLSLASAQYAIPIAAKPKPSFFSLRRCRCR